MIPFKKILNYSHQQLPYQLGKPASSATIKQSIADFCVKEQLDFSLTGEGEHEWIFIEKKGLNTQDVISCLSKLLGIERKQIGYSGLKDRNAVTQQWFSLHLPGKASVNWQSFGNLPFKVLQSSRHIKKLHIGSHQANEFRIVAHFDRLQSEQIEQRVALIRKSGFPNYFGEQRFGTNNSNIYRALQWMKKNHKISRAKKSLYLSAVRSAFFNLMLANRICQGGLNKLTINDHLMLSGSNSFFVYKDINEHDELEKRLIEKDVSICQQLPGLNSEKGFNQYELKFLDDEMSEWLDLLKKQSLKVAYRSIRALCDKLDYDINKRNKTVEFRFVLEKGQFATSLLRELTQIR